MAHGTVAGLAAAARTPPVAAPLVAAPLVAAPPARHQLSPWTAAADTFDAAAAPRPFRPSTSLPSYSVHDVNGMAHAPVPLGRLRPGDIGFSYRRKRQSVRQRVISLGQLYVRYGLSALNRGDPYVMHSFVVTRVDPEHRRITIADAMATKREEGIARIAMDFGATSYSNVDPGSDYLFYRLRDDDLRQQVVRLSRAWSRSSTSNFNFFHCLLAPWRHKRQCAQGRQRLLYMARFADWPSAVPARSGQGEYKMMCSEFVGNVLAVSAMRLYAVEHGLAVNDAACLQAVEGGGRLGRVLEDCDVRALTPCALQARLGRDAQVEVLGFRPSLASEMQEAYRWPQVRTPRLRSFAPTSD